jgi:hypothetical protein
VGRIDTPDGKALLMVCDRGRAGSASEVSRGLNSSRAMRQSGGM